MVCVGYGGGVGVVAGVQEGRENMKGAGVVSTAESNKGGRGRQTGRRAPSTLQRRHNKASRDYHLHKQE
jgi:hypothetical protein